MQIYMPDRLYTLDLDDSHLSQEEIAEIVKRNAAEQVREKEREREYLRKINSFRWQGGCP